MININFIYRFILNTIIENKGKTILLFLILIFYSLAGSFDDVESKSVIIKEIEVNESKYYITSIDDKLNLIEKNNDLIIKNNQLIQYNYNDGNVLFWFLFGFSVFILLIASFDDDGGWNFDYVSRKTIRDFIRCDEEEGKYNYHIFSKLITRSDRMLYRDEFNIKLNDLKILPEYKSKSMIRENKLKKLGII
jgi:hypothetical protein